MFAQIFCRYLRNNRILIVKISKYPRDPFSLDSFIATSGSSVFCYLILNSENSQQSVFSYSKVASLYL